MKIILKQLTKNKKIGLKIYSPKVRTVPFISFLLFFALTFVGCTKKESSNAGYQQSSSVVKSPLTTTPESATEEGIAGLFNDPLAQEAWHLNNTGQKGFTLYPAVASNDIDILGAWKLGMRGRGVKILISHNGVDLDHEDLSENVIDTKIYRSTPFSNEKGEGTAIAGIIAAVGDNQLGSLGVAPKAKFSANNFLIRQDVPGAVVEQASGDFDIFNYSYNKEQSMYTAIDPGLLEQYKRGVTKLRDGKGAVYVKSAGNEFLVLNGGASGPNIWNFGNANLEGDNNSPYTILVSSLNANGRASFHSSPGSNIWVASLGGEKGNDEPAILSTDIEGCDFGLQQSKSIPPNKRHPVYRDTRNIKCNYTALLGETAAATAVLSGVVALMLEANPSLTWRDVKIILAKTADSEGVLEEFRRSPVLGEQVQDTKHPFNYLDKTLSSASDPLLTDSTFEYGKGWVKNAAGLSFHNWYGFGRVNAKKAVEMASTYSAGFLPEFKTYSSRFSPEFKTQFSKENEKLLGACKEVYATVYDDPERVLLLPNRCNLGTEEFRDSPPLYSNYITGNMSVGVNYNIESVKLTLKLQIRKGITENGLYTQKSPDLKTSCSETPSLALPDNGEKCGQYGVELISPSGTKSILQPIFSNMSVTGNPMTVTFLSNAFLEESSKGVWSLRVINPQNQEPVDGDKKIVEKEPIDAYCFNTSVIPVPVEIVQDESDNAASGDTILKREEGSADPQQIEGVSSCDVKSTIEVVEEIKEEHCYPADKPLALPGFSINLALPSATHDCLIETDEFKKIDPGPVIRLFKWKLDIYGHEK